MIKIVLSTKLGELRMTQTPKVKVMYFAKLQKHGINTHICHGAAITVWRKICITTRCHVSRIYMSARTAE